jgi:isoleucyl-tRNA synthetase
LCVEVRPNPKTLGPKFGPRLKDVQAAIAAADPNELAAKVAKGLPFDLACAGGPVSLEPSDLWVSTKAPDGWTGVADGASQVTLDVRITPELAREGLARDVVRQVQELRKEANLEKEDRIELCLETASEELRTAIDAHRGYIADETLTVRWPAGLDGDAHRKGVKIDRHELTIALRPVRS